MAKSGYGLTVYGTKSIDSSAKYEGYAPLVDVISEFFLGADAPVSPDETLEMFTFMQAADVSKADGGVPVSLDRVWKESLQRAESVVEQIDR